MKQLVFDNIKILIANTKYSFQMETAYWSGNLASLISTTLYTLTYLIFIDVLYSNFDLIAGYNLNQMNFFFLFSQVTAFTFFIISDNITKLIENVNTGNLDLILTKPISALFFLSFSKIRLFSMTRDAFPPLLAIVIAINWGELDISLINMLSALLVFILGMLIAQAFLWIAALPVFWLGESSQLFAVAQETWFASGATIPFEGIPSLLKIIFIYLIPGIIPAALAASVALGKTDALTAILISLLVLIVFFILRFYLWKVALRNYTSASS